MKPTSSSAAVADFTYTYDKNGNVTQIQDGVIANELRSMAYDGLDRLITASGPWGNGSYTYDTVGNLKTKTLGSRNVNLTYQSSTNRLAYSIDSANGNVANAYTYDTRGNVTNNGRQSFVYDYANQPISATGSGVSASFVYDGNLKRVKQTVDGETIYTVYSKTGSILLRDNVSTNEKTDYVRMGNLTVAELKNGIAEYVFSDHLGTPVVGTNQSQTVLWRESRTPFGEKYTGSVSRKDRVGYTGHIDDDKLKLTYMQARYYDPVIGRFYSNDPVGAVSHLNTQNGIHGFNRYAYANNNPYKFTDPTGESSSAITLPKEPSGRIFVYPKSSHTHVTKRHASGSTLGSVNQFKSNLTMSSYEVASVVASAVISGGEEFYQTKRETTAFTAKSKVPIGNLGEVDITVATKTLSTLSHTDKIAEVTTMLNEAGIENFDPSKVEVIMTIAPDAGNMIDENSIKK